MKITIVGGGPAGLWFALLMKKRDPRLSITIHERNSADNTFGFGVVFSRKTTDLLRRCDDELFRRAEGLVQAWEKVVIVHRDQRVDVGGNHFAGVARITWNRLLQERCRELGVELRFESDVADPRRLQRECDLLVGADGVISAVRDAWKDAFEPTLDARRNRYIWLATAQPFDGLTLTFRQAPEGLFMAHSYRFSASQSTFIIECGEAPWRAAGFDRLEEIAGEATLKRLERIFAPDLGGNRLVGNRSKWIQFLLVKNRSWTCDNVVLMGDAAHTAHFSIGSGTKLAMEDSIALYECFGRSAGVREALADYNATRKPVVDAYQENALASTAWFEEAGAKLHLEPLPFAVDCMFRSGKIDLENLRRRDAAFVDRFEAWQAGPR
jgi:anthraniloyl-CoA monooxygenase